MFQSRESPKNWDTSPSKLCCNIATLFGFRDVDSDLKEMGVASAVKWSKGDFELLDIFDSSAFPHWADACFSPAKVVAALDEDLLISDEESSSAEEETLNNQSICGSTDLNQNIDLPLCGTENELKRPRSRSGSEESFSDSSTSCSEEGELGAATADVEEFERQVARLGDSSELEEVSRGEHQAMSIIIASPSND